MREAGGHAIASMLAGDEQREARIRTRAALRPRARHSNPGQEGDACPGSDRPTTASILTRFARTVRLQPAYGRATLGRVAPRAPSVSSFME